MPSGRTEIVCNTAAIVTLLAESAKFNLFPSDDGIGSPEPDSMTHASDEDSVMRSEALWSPYLFGIQHGILDPCRLCMELGPSIFAPPPRMHVDQMKEACECRWTQ